MKKIYLLWILSFLLFGCASQPSLETKKETPESFVVPTSDSTMGVINGKISLPPGEKLEKGLFLSLNITAGSPDIPSTVAFSYESDLRAAQLDTGEFYFSNVPPGQYALVIFDGVNVNVVPDPENSGFFLLVDIRAGETKDIGLITLP